MKRLVSLLNPLLAYKFSFYRLALISHNRFGGHFRRDVLPTRRVIALGAMHAVPRAGVGHGKFDLVQML